MAEYGGVVLAGKERKKILSQGGTVSYSVSKVMQTLLCRDFRESESLSRYKEIDAGTNYHAYVHTYEGASEILQISGREIPPLVLPRDEARAQDLILEEIPPETSCWN